MWTSYLKVHSPVKISLQTLGFPKQILTFQTHTNSLSFVYTVAYFHCESNKVTKAKLQSVLLLNHPQLPYYIDGDLKITQSNAILRYISRKHDLCGRTETERVKVDMLENLAMDIRVGHLRFIYNDYVSLITSVFYNTPNNDIQFIDIYRSKERNFWALVLFIIYGPLNCPPPPHLHPHLTHLSTIF